MASVQFVLAGALALVMFVMLANLVVVQYGRGAIRSALEQGVRSGSVSGPRACEATVASVVSDLLGGAMSDDLVVSCRATGGATVADARATFQAWLPLMPEFQVALESRATEEP